MVLESYKRGQLFLESKAFTGDCISVFKSENLTREIYTKVWIELINRMELNRNLPDPEEGKCNDA